MTEKTEVSLHDLVALTQALGVPCSPEAASCMLLNAHAAAKLGHAGQLGASGQLTKRDLAKHDTHSSSSDCILNVKVTLENGHTVSPLCTQSMFRVNGWYVACGRLLAAAFQRL